MHAHMHICTYSRARAHIHTLHSLFFRNTITNTGGRRSGRGHRKTGELGDGTIYINMCI